MFAAIQCENGFVYKPCVDPCQDLECNEEWHNKTCKHDCVEGCGCKDDEVAMSGKCVKRDSLTCTDPETGKEYVQGTRLVGDCEIW